MDDSIYLGVIVFTIWDRVTVAVFLLSSVVGFVVISIRKDFNWRVMKIGTFTFGVWHNALTFIVLLWRIREVGSRDNSMINNLIQCNKIKNNTRLRA